MPDLIIIACGRKKRKRAAIAADLYAGPYFRACLAYANALVGAGGWRRLYVLSAKYGLRGVTEWTAPYDALLTDRGAVKAEEVRSQVEALELTEKRVLVLGGQRYVKLAREVWPEAEAPLTGQGGIGAQIKWLRGQTRERRARSNHEEHGVHRGSKAGRGADAEDR